MKCIDCIHLDLQAYPKHAGLGMGKCKVEQMSGVFYPISRDRECEKFQTAATEKILRRESWWKTK